VELVAIRIIKKRLVQIAASQLAMECHSRQPIVQMEMLYMAQTEQFADGARGTLELYIATKALDAL
jgi:hypothetical protein